MTPRALGALLAIFLVPLVPAHAEAPTFDTSWLHVGFTASYVGQSVGLAPSGQPNDPSRGGLFTAEIIALDAETVTFRFSGLDGWSAMAAYDVATRKQSGTWARAIVWVNEDDVARGSAIIGEKAAILVHSDGALHQFESGGTSYYFDARTGLLSHVVSVGYGGAATRIPG